MDDYLISNTNCFAKADNTQKGAFLTALCTLANIDKKITPEEIRFIKQLAASINIEIKPGFFACPPETCIKSLTSFPRRLALELLKYLLALAYADNEFTDSEGRFICHIADALNIEPQKVSEISSWIIDRIIWLEQKDLIFEETSPAQGGKNG